MKDIPRSTRIDSGIRSRSPLCVSPAAILLASLLSIAAGCGRGDEGGAKAASKDTKVPLNERLGWVHGSCLASANPNLTVGTPVLLVLMKDPQATATAEIGGRTSSSETCKPLLEDRAKQNTKGGTAFYALNAGAIGATDMGVAIANPPATSTVVNGQVNIDLDGSGHPDVFSSCTTSEGIRFAAWAGEAYRGEPLWTGYYYLGYSSPANCPN